MSTALYADVILPLPLNATFTYRVPDEYARIKAGFRVIVPFGSKKYYTGIVASTSVIAPTGYEVKDIAMVLDCADCDTPAVEVLAVDKRLLPFFDR